MSPSRVTPSAPQSLNGTTQGRHLWSSRRRNSQIGRDRIIELLLCTSAWAADLDLVSPWHACRQPRIPSLGPAHHEPPDDYMTTKNTRFVIEWRVQNLPASSDNRFYWWCMGVRLVSWYVCTGQYTRRSLFAQSRVAKWDEIPSLFFCAAAIARRKPVRDPTGIVRTVYCCNRLQKLPPENESGSFPQAGRTSNCPGRLTVTTQSLVWPPGRKNIDEQ